MSADMSGFIKAIADPRLWQAADNFFELTKRAAGNDCDCTVCIELRAIAGFLDDLKAEHGSDGT